MMGKHDLQITQNPSATQVLMRRIINGGGLVARYTYLEYSLLSGLRFEPWRTHSVVFDKKKKDYILSTLEV